MKVATTHRALFGSAFDPIHNGHVFMLERLLHTEWLETIHMIPYLSSPLGKSPIASTNDRLAMLQLICNQHERCTIDTLELQRPVPTYTIDTLSSYRQAYPTDQLYCVISTESLQSFTLWKDWETVLAHCHLLCFKRDGATDNIDHPKLKKRITTLKSIPPQEDTGMIIMIDAIPPAIASHQIRMAIASDQAIQSGLPTQIRAYIENHQLYQPKDSS